MSLASLHQFLVIYAWFPLAALLGLLLLIARFYQKFSGERTYYWLFLVPVVLFGGVAVRDAGSGLGADLVSALLAGTGGLLLVLLSARLFYLMLWKNTDPVPDGAA